MTSRSNLVGEAVTSLAEAWEHMVSRLPGGRVEQLEGVAVRWADVALPFLNVCIVDSPCADAQELRRRLDAMLAHVAGEEHPWLGCVCEEWLPADWRDVVAEAGLHVSMPMTGMVAERILPPRRRAPDLELRRVEDARSRAAVGTLNNLAYGLPDGMCDCIADPTFWPEDVHGYVGAVAGEDVTTTSVFPASGALYVALVATHPEHGRQGYAEHVMRAALDRGGAALGLSRSILHASEAGRPVYAAMGYEDMARFALLSTEPSPEG